MAEGQQPEEGLDLREAQLHILHQGVVVEGELGVCQRIEGEIHYLSVLGEVGEMAEDIREQETGTYILIKPCVSSELTSLMSTLCPA